MVLYTEGDGNGEFSAGGCSADCGNQQLYGRGLRLATGPDAQVGQPLRWEARSEKDLDLCALWLAVHGNWLAIVCEKGAAWMSYWSDPHPVYPVAGCLHV